LGYKNKGTVEKTLDHSQILNVTYQSYLFLSVYDQSTSGVLSDDTWLGVQGKESIASMGRDQPTANQALLQLNMYLSL